MKNVLYSTQLSQYVSLIKFYFSASIGSFLKNFFHTTFKLLPIYKPRQNFLLTQSSQGIYVIFYDSFTINCQLQSTPDLLPIQVDECKLRGKGMAPCTTGLLQVMVSTAKKVKVYLQFNTIFNPTTTKITVNNSISQ